MQEAGANLFRINMAHGRRAIHEDAISNIKKCGAECLIDLQGVFVIGATMLFATVRPHLAASAAR